MQVLQCGCTCEYMQWERAALSDTSVTVWLCLSWVMQELQRGKRQHWVLQVLQNMAVIMTVSTGDGKWKHWVIHM